MKDKFQNTAVEELIAACRKGNRKAQMEIYQRYYKSMYNVSLRILNDSAEAEDVMQESFMSAFQKLDSFSGEVTFGAWLKKIVVNRSLDALRKKKALISIDQAPDFPEESSEDYFKFGNLTINTIKEALFSMPQGYRIVLSLYLLEGYDHEEIAQILNISNTTSRTQYFRAKRKLAAKLMELKEVS